MKIETKKRVAKEILILFICFISSFLILVCLYLNNSYQKFNQNRINQKIQTIKLENDSLDKPIDEYYSKIYKFKKEVFYQICSIVGGSYYKDPLNILEPIPKLPKEVYNKEKIGEDSITNSMFKEFGGSKLYYYYLKYDDENNYKQFNSLEDHLNNIKLIDEKQFFDSIEKYPNYKIEIFNKLKENFNSSNCSTIDKFDFLIGLKKELEIKDKISKKEVELSNLNKLKNDYSISLKRTISTDEILNITFISFLLFFLFAFVVRYIIITIKWCIKILTIK